MSEDAAVRQNGFSPSVVYRLDRICDHFEAAWKNAAATGQRPQIEEYLCEASEAERCHLLPELIALDIAYRRLAGEQPQLEEYRARFPSLDPAQLNDPCETVRQRPTPSAPPPMMKPPEIPGYEILAELGRGGMGIVYQAWQSDLRRLVALKMVLTGAHASPQELSRFRTEAEAVGRLQHPHIVQIYEVGQQDLHPYMVLEYVDGGSLAKKLNGTPLPARQAAHWVLTLAQAVEYAHQRGIVHRDLTPANVLLAPAEPPQGLPLEGSTEAGRCARFIPKLSDFGLAKLVVGGGPTLTQSGTTLGTPSYMAPEQAGGRTKEIGPATDVYALGAILYELLTGRPPFKAETALETLAQVQSQEPISPSRLQPKVPRDLATICLKCLEKAPARRYASAEALAEDLRRYLAGEPIWARPIGRVERLGRWCRRNPLIALLLTLVAVLLVSIAVVSTFLAVRLNTALAKTRDAERQGRLREAEALVGYAHGIRYSRRPGQRFEALAALRRAAEIGHELGQPPEWFDQLRNIAIAAMALPDVHITDWWDGFPPGTYRAEVSSDFQFYARTTLQGACSVCRVADDVEIAQLPELGGPANVGFGPGGLLVFYGGAAGRLQLWDLTGPQPVRRLDEPRAHSGYNFRADGRLIALGYRDGSIGVYMTDMGKRQFYLAAQGIRDSPGPALHPTDPIVASCSYYSDLLQIRDLQTGAVRVSLRLPWRKSSMCAWSPDGRTLAVSAGEIDNEGDRTNLYAFEAPAGSLRLTHVLRGQSNGGTAIAFNPAGDRLATRGWNGKVHLFDVATGRLLFVTHSLPSTNVPLLHFDPTGRWLAATRVGARQEKIGLWSVADAREYRAFIHDGVGPSDQLDYGSGTLAVHPDGRLAAQGFKDGLALFDLETGREFAVLRIPKLSGSVWFDGAGNLLSNGYGGFFRWPVRPDPTRPGRLIVGPGERLSFKPGNRPIAASRDGKVIAQAMYAGYGMSQHAGGWILHPSSPQPRRIEAGASMATASVHPDGRWVAFGKHVNSVCVYEAATGRRVWQSPVDRHNSCRFSPDGRWLVTDNDGGRAYAVDTWEPGPALGPGIPWDVSPDGRLVVLGQTDGIYRLVELATGRELARLEDPDRTAGCAVFTTDGTRQVVAAADGPRVWDLRALRQQLAEMGLDWDLPPYESVKDNQPAPPLEVQVELGDAFALLPGGDRSSVGVNSLLLALNPFQVEAYYQRGRAYDRLGAAQQAIADYSTVLDLMPPLQKRYGEVLFRRSKNYARLNDVAKEHGDLQRLTELDLGLPLELQQEVAVKCNGLAWQYVSGPETQRDPKRALPLAQKAVKLRPDWGPFGNTLGVVYYRLGQDEQAIATLQQSARQNKPEHTAYDLFFLAMCHARRGEATKAKDCYDRAVHAVREHQAKLPADQQKELADFRAEAEALLRRD